MVKNHAKFEELGIRQISPEGWLRDFLQKQSAGLTGNIEAAGAPFDSVGWDRFDENAVKSDGHPGWWAYEQTAYHLDGMTRLAELTGDRRLRAKAGRAFSHVLSNADPDGYLGPKELKNSSGWNRWPHVVFFRALLAKYSATGDKTILDALRRHYLEGEQTHDRARDVINAEIMLLTYLFSGDERLLAKAEKDFASYNLTCRDDNCASAQLSSSKAYAHGVTYNEYAKLGALFYICTGKKSYLKPSVHAYKKIDRRQMLPDGLHCSNEFLLDNDYMQSHETCDVSDYTWALGYLLMATGKGEYADKIEKCIFNAGVGSVEERFRALQYFSCVNQVILDRTSNHNDFFCGNEWMRYAPNPGTACCAGNVHRFMPNYCARMWMKKGRTVAAVLYGPSTVTLGKGKMKTVITEDTAYPFEDTIRFSFENALPHRISFAVRIPGWCDSPKISVNGSYIDCAVKNGFAVIDRVFENKDRVTVVLPAGLSVRKWGKNGLYVERGPLVFSLGMKGRREIDESEEGRSVSPDFPAYNIYPDRPFNYALIEDQTPQLHRISGGKDPFTMEHCPLTVRVLARRVPGWKITSKNKVLPVHDLYTRPWKREERSGRFTFTPRFPSPAAMQKAVLGAPEEITLYPYGAAKLRITVFPAVPQKKEK